MMKINIAKSAGFCFGVKRAVDTVYKESSKMCIRDSHGTIDDSYDLSCDMERKRVECAIMIKAALADTEGEEE